VKKWFKTLEVIVTQHDPTELVGPTDGGLMTLPVYESIRAHVKVTLKRGSTTLLTTESPLSGFEYMMKG